MPGGPDLFYQGPSTIPMYTKVYESLPYSSSPQPLWAPKTAFVEDIFFFKEMAGDGGGEVSE